MHILICKAGCKIAKLKADKVTIAAKCSGCNAAFDKLKFAGNLTIGNSNITLNISGTLATIKVISAIIGRYGKVS